MLASSLTLLVDKHGAKIQARGVFYTFCQLVGFAGALYPLRFVSCSRKRRASHALGVFRADGGLEATNRIVYTCRYAVARWKLG